MTFKTFIKSLICVLSNILPLVSYFNVVKYSPKKFIIYLLILINLTVYGQQVPLYHCILILLSSYIGLFLINYMLNILDKVYITKYRDLFVLKLKDYVEHPWFRPFFRIFYIYLSFIFILRNYFKQERAWILYAIGVFAIINTLLPLFFLDFTSVNIKELISMELVLGLNLLSYDTVGDLAANYLLNYPKTSFNSGLYTFLTSTQKNPFVLIRHVGRLAYLGSLIIGKTNMTSTGRATIAVGVLTGISLTGTQIYLQQDNHAFQAKEAALQREHSTTEAQTQREFTAGESAKDRALEYDKMSHAEKMKENHARGWTGPWWSSKK
jgi:hypothetical protein